MADKIRIKNLCKTFVEKSGETKVLDNISLDVKENEFLVLLGPGQCGKTVLLNILAGLDTPTSGTINYIKGNENGKEDIKEMKMGEIGMVFQKYALFPWKTVIENVEMSQKLKGIDKEQRRKSARNYIKLVGLENFEDSYPKQLSGGMKQRVGIARAYASESDILLMDEPFGALDAQTRYQMGEEILKMWRKDKRTVIFVTNNIEEAIYLGDRIILLSGCPATVKAEYIPKLERPRDYMALEFLQLRKEIADNTDLAL
ncbi:NitT/TauT family transport system ATP-binding protein/sulfonate transport system ATP-binding protein [Anaerobacterium chartisolvens]|uniref:NitT/TauT family transport system ATP-binding protein/sulfonate transport system ATP-binding protein n=1 Tax=Anaerobacterium chartisolvens TaxID=1297424 RepID=A0A369BFP6_9FIRM|nr:ABC transporter ATP-binding protein [Anaerobacterium chartisolvens]RCX20085.1 NitT/TauT family transport system ATP-binding protein/sulfonate transport system ATP-binding protein [Anaerobacterium chartisolvens]